MIRKYKISIKMNVEEEFPVDEIDFETEDKIMDYVIFRIISFLKEKAGEIHGYYKLERIAD
jgi:hypothetical protein